ncbi:integrase [Pontibacter aydingkolensis]|uniref:Phage integrase SAM-like domain-containing protein n=1 Tax=Pontibacter aydingkolensis TaxID=1911536 RepID=A0ABS7CUS1_9BACT|nr:phage integrase SAM-like domain-containing protein [Pontibacter aydingkolensis]MBW7467582.1 phage integrase SAM-like domain-containing protein [Pontibacter aydingkolensis]
MFTTKAYLQTNQKNKDGLAPIYLRYTYKRKANGIGLGLTVNPEFFDSKKGIVKPSYPNCNSINNAIRTAQTMVEDIAASLTNPEFKIVKERYLKRVEKLKAKPSQRNETQYGVDEFNLLSAQQTQELIAKHTQILNDLVAKQQEFTLTEVKIESYDEMEFKRLLQEYPKKFITPNKNTIKQLKTWAKTLMEFGSETNTPLRFDAFDYNFYNAYAKYLLYSPKHNYYNNNFGNHVKKLKGFLRWCENEQNIAVNSGYKKFKVLKEEKEIVYLSSEELNLLWEHRRSVKPEFVKYIDICVFQNLTGLRYSDVKRSLWKVENGILQGITKKTKGNYNIPLLLDERIEIILKTYNYKLNLVSEVKFNKYIKLILKDLFEKHKINQVKIAIRKEKLAEEFVEYYYKWELITSHSGRRGFCTRLWQAGYTERDVLLMLGSTTSEILRKYIKNSTEDLLRKVREKQTLLTKTS